MNICIVDDDQYVIDKIVDGMDWEQLGINLVLTANNIRQAMGILETNKVDILVSDIEMPQGSGLELLEWVREEGLKTECVYVSSYAHFAYAQKALHLDSKGYLLKPITNRELAEVLRPIINKLKLEQNNIHNQDDEKEASWRKLLFDHQLDDVLSNYYQKDKITYGLLQIHNHLKRVTSQEMMRIFFRTKYLMEDLFESMDIDNEFIIRRSEETFIIVWKNTTDEHILSHWKTIKEKLEEKIDGIWTLFLSKTVDVPKILESEMLDDMMLMFEQGIPNKDQILLLKNWRGNRGVYDSSQLSLWERELITRNDFEEVGRKMKNELDVQWNHGNANRVIYREFRKDFQQMIYHYLKDNQLTLSQLLETKEFDYFYDQSIDSLENMKMFVDIILTKLEGVKRLETSTVDVISQILEYINEHPEEDLSRSKLASRAYLSEDYLSKKFTEKTGVSIPYYVNQIRMRKAKKYFEATELSVSEVAISVGYSNFSYFSKVFREHIGCTPNQFRIKLKFDQ